MIFSEIKYSWRSVSSVYGKIDTLLLTYPGGAKDVSSSIIKDRYGPLFKAFGDRVKIVILVNLTETDNADYLNLSGEAKSSFEEAMQASHLQPNDHVICISSPLTIPSLEAKKAEVVPLYNHSQWVQDAFTVLRRQDGTTALLEPIYQLHSQNAMVAEQIASVTDILIKPTRLHLEGGNILVGDDYAFIGGDLLERNRLEIVKEKLSAEENESEFISRFKKELGITYLIPIGGTKKYNFSAQIPQGKEKMQAIFHIDHFLTLGGKNEHGDELVFLADVEQNLIFDEREDESLKEKFRNELNGYLDDLKSYISSGLSKQPGPRFEVRRFEMPIHISEEGKVTLYSYNNSQVEWFLGIKRIYLPSYRPPHLDKSLFEKVENGLRGMLSGLGFRVHFVDNAFDRYALHNGSLHCLTKVLKRTLY